MLFLPGFHFLHCLGQQSAVQVEPHRPNVAALLRPQDIARPADFEVLHGDPEPSAKLGGIKDGLEAFPGRLGQPLAPFIQKIGVCPDVSPPHPAPQMIQLGQTKIVGVIDYQSIDIG